MIDIDKILEEMKVLPDYHKLFINFFTNKCYFIIKCIYFTIMI